MEKNCVKENSGITLLSLVITIIVLLILATISTYSGITIVENLKFNKYTAQMKTMQSQINLIYEKYKNGETISINGNSYTGEKILDIGSIVTSEVTAKKDKIFDELQEDSEAGIYEKENYKFWSEELIKQLGIEGVEGSFFVNIEKRNFISYDGIEHMGKTYYTLNQLPDNLYNVEYLSEVDKVKVAKKLLESNTKIVSDDGVDVLIPADFTISDESPNNAKEGIIITDSIDENTGKSNGNEFVWIPINPDLTVVGTEKIMAKESTADGYTGKDDNDRTNYESVFYDFTGTGSTTESTEMPSESNGQGTLGRREPDSGLHHDGAYGDKNFLENLPKWLPEEAERYKDYDTFKKTLQEDYNEMIDSVKTYGGFYVGRYEMGAKDVIANAESSGKATSKKGLVTNALNWFVSRQWYGLYLRAKTYTNTKNSVKSHMIWGCQYDAMLNYALTGNDKEKVTATGNGYHGENASYTEITPGDKILNIFDLAGNHAEWTLEAYTQDYRIARGGYYSDTGDFSPSSRVNWVSDNASEFLGTRLTLYINPT